LELALIALLFQLAIIVLIIKQIAFGVQQLTEMEDVFHMDLLAANSRLVAVEIESSIRVVLYE